MADRLRDETHRAVGHREVRSAGVPAAEAVALHVVGGDLRRVDAELAAAEHALGGVGPAAEIVPPTFSVTFLSSPLPGHSRIRVTAQDPSGIDAVELYRKTEGFTSFEWDEVEFLQIASGGGATPVQLTFDVAFADLGDELQVAVYDVVGNVAHRSF